MKIAIIGTRGIPNNHGGFEQFAEFLAPYLAGQKHEVIVYNSHDHPNQEKIWNDVKIAHKYDPESKIGTAGQFIYDFNCIFHCRRMKYDVILQLGYTSSSIWGWLLPSNSVIVTNMDGLEWKRSKYKKPVQKFLKYAEKLAVKSSDFLISDSIGIQDYLKEKYKVESEYIAYGATLFETPNIDVIKEYNINKGKYNMLIARLEPENNIETIVKGVVNSNTKFPLLIVGKHKTSYGEYLKEKYQNEERIKFIGGIYNQDHLNNLRYFSNIYFHGHSVGGTNPSLLEAMASNALIVANDNVFNKSILNKEAFYFQSSEDVSELLTKNKNDYKNFIQSNKEKVIVKYDWDLINTQYEKYLMKCLEQ